MKNVIKKILKEEVDNRRDVYLNNIVGYIVDDTIIDFGVNQIRFPFSLLRTPFLRFLNLHYSKLNHFPLFSEYCKDNYGLTEDEIDYVWEEYKNIIINKIKNRH
jgi:hypothetical protein